MDRAYSLLEVRSVNDGERVISGIASTPTPDRMGDIVEPLGAQIAGPVPLLWQHDSKQPIGQVEFGKPTKAGIPFTAHLAQIDEAGALKDRLDMAWQSIKLGLVRAVSIGFRAIEVAWMDTGGMHFLSWEMLELSAVTIPANPDATINTIRSLDRAQMVASGIELPPEDRPAPDTEIPADPEDKAASGQTVHVVKLNTPARDRAPFVINKIKHLG